MSGFQINQIVAAILATLLVVIGARVLSNIVYEPSPHGGDPAVHEVVPAEPEASAPAVAPEPAEALEEPRALEEPQVLEEEPALAAREPEALEPEALEPEALEPEAVEPEAPEATGFSALLAAADPDAGKKVAKKCGACHTFEAGGPNKLGPNLWNVVGRPVASLEGFNYSPAMSGLGGSWELERLAAFVANPKEYLPGNKMSFPGVKKEADRANLIAYLRLLSD
ncbi:MAG: c-type cytochrome [Proteobacteria bacterium]|nr:c-type cytochrome [Pseudomonadota bacterium]